ncbi:MAG: hypothetical protein ACYTGH_02520, partial [Planctomycetota bacterium]
MSDDFSQDEIDKILEDALGGPSEGFSSEEEAAAESTLQDAGGESEPGGDDIDSLLAGALDTEKGTEDNAGAEADSSDLDGLLSDALGDSGGGEEEQGAQSQDDIDSLLAGALSDESPSEDA